MYYVVWDWCYKMLERVKYIGILVRLSSIDNNLFFLFFREMSNGLF